MGLPGLDGPSRRLALGAGAGVVLAGVGWYARGNPALWFWWREVADGGTHFYESQVGLRALLMPWHPWFGLAALALGAGLAGAVRRAPAGGARRRSRPGV